MLKRHSSGGRLGQDGISSKHPGEILKSIAAAVVADIHRPTLEIRRHILIFRIIMGAYSNFQTFDPIVMLFTWGSVCLIIQGIAREQRELAMKG